MNNNIVCGGYHYCPKCKTRYHSANIHICPEDKKQKKIDDYNER